MGIIVRYEAIDSKEFQLFFLTKIIDKNEQHAIKSMEQ